MANSVCLPSLTSGAMVSCWFHSAKGLPFGWTWSRRKNIYRSNGVRLSLENWHFSLVRRQSEARPVGRVSLSVLSGMPVPLVNGSGMPPSFLSKRVDFLQAESEGVG